MIVVMIVAAAVSASAGRDVIQPILVSGNDENSVKVRLGERLFRDTVISPDHGRSCSSCHDLDTNGTIPATTSAHAEPDVLFNVPSIFNVGLNFKFGWRGDLPSLAEQTESALTTSGTPGPQWHDIVDRLLGDETYVRDFKSAYGNKPNRTAALDALVLFQLSLATPAPFDEFLSGNQGAINEDAKAGFRLFRDYGCASCHQGANIGGNMFQRFGIFAPTVDPKTVTDKADLGRFDVTQTASDLGVYRVPSLRNVEVTAPYLHDGRSKTLPETIVLMGRNQLGHDLSSNDVSLIAAFLKTLTGKYHGRKLHAPGP